jgi:tRNA (guanine37-N1)-methyltransferase
MAQEGAVTGAPSSGEDQTRVASSSTPQPVEVRPLAAFPALSTFTRAKTYPALVAPVQRIAELRKKLSTLLLRLPRVKTIYPAESSPTERILLLVANNDDDEKQGKALDSPVVLEFLRAGEIRATEYTLQLSYDDLTVDDILQSLLAPVLEEIPSAFEAVGHLAHVNLRDAALPYKYWIGKVLLDKNQPRIRTVVNKLGSIANEFRTFGMEVIAGNEQEGWSEVTVKEEGCAFCLDFRQVYWNSRLAGEHRRLVSLLHKEARKSTSSAPLVVADLMAGVGPFAVPLTVPHKDANVKVYANDLNPSSYKYLQINRKKNKCGPALECFNQDGRAFLRALVHERGIAIDHAILNLPATAPEFLDAFTGYPFGMVLPRLHVHCFAPKEAASSNYQCAVDRCARALGLPEGGLDRSANAVHVHVVRDVSPQKNMLCVSFVLPAAVVQSNTTKQPADTRLSATNDDGPAAKRVKSGEDAV